MKTTTIKRDKVFYLSEIVRIANKAKGDVFIKQGNFIVNAKSIMGIVSLGFLKDAEVSVELEEDEFIIDEINKLV
ncbi:MAG: HPr family phosphocarrier protein [Candidatus Woesearchaeota archaeon]